MSSGVSRHCNIYELPPLRGPCCLQLFHSACGEMRQRLSDLSLAEKRIEHQQSFKHPFLSGKVQLVLSAIPVADRCKVNTSPRRNKPLRTGISELSFFFKIIYLFLIKNDITMFVFQYQFSSSLFTCKDLFGDIF